MDGRRYVGGGGLLIYTGSSRAHTQKYPLMSLPPCLCTHTCRYIDSQISRAHVHPRSHTLAHTRKTRTHTCVCMHTRGHVGMHIHARAHLRTHIHTHGYTHTHTRMTAHAYTRTHTRTHVHTSAHTRGYAHTRIW